MFACLCGNKKMLICRLADYLSNNNLLSSFQSAYIKRHSFLRPLCYLFMTTSLRLRVFSKLLVSLFLTYLLLSTPLIILFFLNGSAWFGITSTALSSIKSYLPNCSFYFNVENTMSSLFQLLYGVPQGSILEPLLLILYTNVYNWMSSNFHSLNPSCLLNCLCIYHIGNNKY